MPDPTWHPRRIALFLALGAVLYLGLLAGSDWLARNRGDANPFYRIGALDGPTRDWVILGASHAMPLDFANMDARTEAATGKSVLNLAATGAGPFLMRLVANRYLMDHRATGVVIVVDGFGFADRRWNEDRLGDSDFLPRVPLDAATASLFLRNLPRVPPTTLADYLTGFSKINNADRLSPDIWDAEARFEDSRRRPPATADAERIAYLYPPGATLQDRYFDDLTATVSLLHASGAHVVLLRPPVPDRFLALLPMEDDLNARLAGIAADQDAELSIIPALCPRRGITSTATI